MDQLSPPSTPIPRERNRVQFFPQHLNAYDTCPERYFLKYVRNVKMPFVWNRSWAIGIVTHSTLAARYNARMAGEPMPELGSLVDRFLAEQSYKNEPPEAREEDRATILSYVDWCEAQFPDDITVEAVEREYSFTRPGTELTARIDLIVRYPDGSIDHVDFKTGKPRRDHFQETIGRIVVCNAYPDTVVRTTILYAADTSWVSDVVERETAQPHIQKLRDTIEAIRTATVWPPRPSGFCRWCTYASICSARPDVHPVVAEDAEP